MAKFQLFCVLFLCLNGLSLSARHIIGGSMSYRCLGNSEYEFTLRLYRDCNCIGCPVLDPVAYIGIYRCTSAETCGAQFNALASLEIPRQSIRNVPPPEYPCLATPDVCVEEGIYVFRYILPATNASYHISFQRCCRDETMANILTPGGTGATYTVEITPEAQRQCNSSPSFAVVPPTVICAGATLTYDHAASEEDGDSLVYELCAPLVGAGSAGGQQGSQLIFTCTGSTPRPACPPPYRALDYRFPYSAAYPMPGEPALSIDAKTGLIQLKPTAIGRFAVGVCVKEYRKGVLLSTINRDFQFNVTDGCSPILVPKVKADQIIADKEFLIRYCGSERVVGLTNESTPVASIKNINWRFDLKTGDVFLSSLWSPQITFPDTGRYLGKLILNPGFECADSAKVWIHVLPLLQADFSYQYDTCKASPVQFRDRSIAHSKYIKQWSWQFDALSPGSTLPNPSFRYTTPGFKAVSLSIRDTNRCQSTISKVVPYFPAPPVLLVAPDASEGCEPAVVTFVNRSTPIDTTYRVEWQFGDGSSSKRISPSHVYQQDGLYSVSLSVRSPNGCRTDSVFSNLIRVKPRPKSAFRIEPPEVSNVFPQFRLFDESNQAVRWRWQLGDGRQYTDRNPSTEARELGQLRILQYVYNDVGCLDSSSQVLQVFPEVRYFLPNAFTPNGDSVNDELKAVGIFEGIRNFSIQVWNRWGELVFHSKDPSETWNGQKFNQGVSLPVGVYTVLASYLDPKDKMIEYRGFVTILR